MAYGDYGAFVYKNGQRRHDKEDAPAFNLGVDSFIDLGVAELTLWKISRPAEYCKTFNQCDHMYHGVCGDSSIRVACYKQGLPQIFEATNEGVKLITYYNHDEIEHYEYEPFDFDYKDYRFHFEPGDPYDSDKPYIVEMDEPDGTHWRCEYDYEYGAGFEDE